MRQILTTRGENSVAQVRGVFAIYDALLTGQGDNDPYTTHTGISPEQLVLPRIVSIAEDFVRIALVLASEPQLSFALPLHTDLWARGEERAEASWVALRESWSNWHGLQLSDAPAWNAMDGLIEARNSVMHGLGRLTRKQTRSLRATQRTVAKLAHAQVKLANYELVLDAPVIERSSATCVEFIQWVDYATTTRGLMPLS